jgi:hypothetical protein
VPFAIISAATLRGPVHLSTDPSDGLPGTFRDPELDVGVRKKRVVLGVEVMQPLEQQRRNPSGVVAVEDCRKLQETDEIAATRDRPHLDRRGLDHGHLRATLSGEAKPRSAKVASVG